MPRLTYDSDSLPSPSEFRKALREAGENYDPIDELLNLQQELTALEQSHGMSSAECYRRFYAGELGDDPDIFAWVGKYRGFLGLKAALSESVKLAVTEPQTLSH